MKLTCIYRTVVGHLGIPRIPYLVFWTAVSIALLITPSNVSSVELTFELPDNAKECFHEDIQKGVQTTFEFQVSCEF